MSDPILLDPDSVLSDIEHHFRVTAGPGAGKTRWLAKHVQHVARSSTRLTPCARIAVISYTNVAVREIISRLQGTTSSVDASTIHSFLFRNLVRPYAHFLKDGNGHPLVAHHLIETHGEHYPAHNHLEAWLTECNRRQLLITQRKASLQLLKKRLRSLTVRVNATGTAFFAPCKNEPRDRAIADLLTPERLVDYKRRFWQTGTVDHEDVLYFAFRLLSEFPVIRRFFSARFPYLFIDEFQDTLPVQAELVRWLAAEHTVVGVIGDPEQAIFGFLDANATHFRAFKLKGHKTYAIDGNRRSTSAIVTLLNRVRADGLIQRDVRREAGAIPVVFAGSLAQALVRARSDTAGKAPMLVLARKHDTVLRARRASELHCDDPWEVLEDADPQRSRFLNHVASAVDLAQRRFYDLAIRQLVLGIASRSGFREPLQYGESLDIVRRQSVALSLLEHGVTRHDEMLEKSALNVYNELSVNVPKYLRGLKLKAVKTGRFQEAAAACRYGDLVNALRTTDETRMTRTIHQAKGSQASAVFVILDNEEADHILRPVRNNEEQRIIYVALSRAENQLFVYCPSIDRLPEFAELGLSTLVVGSSER